jgi:hypothetical protein
MLATETESYDFRFQVLKDQSRPARVPSIWDGQLIKVVMNHTLRPWPLPAKDWVSFGVCDGDLQVIAENLRDFVNLLTQIVAMQIPDMTWDQSNGSNREFIRQGLPRNAATGTSGTSGNGQLNQPFLAILNEGMNVAPVFKREGRIFELVDGDHFVLNDRYFTQ